MNFSFKSILSGLWEWNKTLLNKTVASLTVVLVVGLFIGLTSWVNQGSISEAGGLQSGSRGISVALIVILSILIIIGVVVVFIVVEIPSPYFGIRFRRGRADEETALKPGWHIHVPGITEVHIYNGGVQSIAVESPTYLRDRDTGNITSILVRARVYYQANQERLNRIILSPEEEVRERISVLAQTYLRDIVGNAGFRKLVTEKGTIERDTVKELRREMEGENPDQRDSGYGYKILECEIFDFDEEVHSEAGKTNTLGYAEANVAREHAAAVGDSWQAVVARGLQTLLPDVGKAVVNLSKKNRSTGTGNGGS